MLCVWCSSSYTTKAVAVSLSGVFLIPYHHHSSFTCPQSPFLRKLLVVVVNIMKSVFFSFPSYLSIYSTHSFHFACPSDTPSLYFLLHQNPISMPSLSLFGLDVNVCVCLCVCLLSCPLVNDHPTHHCFEILNKSTKSFESP